MSNFKCQKSNVKAEAGAIRANARSIGSPEDCFSWEHRSRN